MINLLAWLLLLSSAQEGEPRFAAYDVFVDADAKTLAAYQIEVVCNASKNKIAGVEGGEPPQFSGAPYYDPAALQGGRIILAAFTTEDSPPTGRVRVARIHMQEAADSKGEYTAKLMTAAAAGGKRIDAKVELVRAGVKK